MPRMTRAAERAQRGLPVTEPSAVLRESSWQIPHEYEFEQESNQAESENEEVAAEPEPEPSPYENPTQGGTITTAFSNTTASQLLKPLQQTADRVSRQVEEFAKCLDRFNSKRHPTNDDLWEDAEGLLQKYGKIARDRKVQIAAKSPGQRTSSRNRQSLEDTENEAQQVQMEGWLWCLMASLINLNHPARHNEATEAQKTALLDLHRYSTNFEIWQAFVGCDIFAQECQEILTWLHETAAVSEPRIEEVVSSLTDKAQRGNGIWSAGWLFTKTAIKAQKRMRAWPKPLEPSDPGIRQSHIRRSDKRPVATQMDPDAYSREDSVLEEQDEFHEQAACRTCWELLRRGMSLDEIREWWLERKEPWRSAALRANGANVSEINGGPWYRFINLATNTKWAACCQFIAKADIDMDPYQSAVLGLLSGDLPSALSVCKTIDDNLFVHFNTNLIQRYHTFIREYNRNLENRERSSFYPADANYDAVRKYLAFAQTDDEAKRELRTPHKAIEAAIVSKDFDTFFVRQGQALSRLASVDGLYNRLIPVTVEYQLDEWAQATVQNPDSLRMIVHLQLLLKALGMLQKPYETNLTEMENNIASYISSLKSEGKFSLIPLYASQLSAERAARVLGTVLIDVTDPKEKDFQSKLMTQYGISMPDVLHAQFSIINIRLIKPLLNKSSALQPVAVTEYVGSGKVKHIGVRSQFIGDELSEEDERAIRTIEWYRYTDKQNWGAACFAASALYKIFILKGQLAGAKALALRAPLREISLAATGMDLSGVDEGASRFDEDGDVGMDDSIQEDKARPISPGRKRKDQNSNMHLLTSSSTSEEVLIAKSRSWRQLEQLATVLDLLEVWSWVAENLEKNREVPGADIAKLKTDLKESLTEIREAMSPIMAPNFLSAPMDSAEAHAFSEIRKYYLPELILAYNSVLFVAGHAISRSRLVECMNLAQDVASNQTLTNAFVESGRMQELVTAFALSSQELLAANEAGGRKGRKGKALGIGRNTKRSEIWQVRHESPNDGGVN